MPKDFETPLIGYSVCWVFRWHAMQPGGTYMVFNSLMEEDCGFEATREFAVVDDFGNLIKVAP